jgi:hypothetical protein
VIRRLVWVGIGAGLAVLVIHQGRRWYEQVVPEPAAGAVDTAVAVSRGLRRVWSDFAAGQAEAESRLTAALVGDRDIDALRASAGERRARLAARFTGAASTDRRFTDWADEPTEDPDDDDGYAF